MQLDKLQLDLRPRPHAQALDLGFSLLRFCAGTVYLSWLALWLPVIALSLLLSYLLPDWIWLWLLLPWWLRPLLERAPLYVMSREVFGEQVNWRQAVKAWRHQLGGGWFRLLTWWRLFMPGRGLYQPIWQLEGLRGSDAADRRRVIGRDGGQAAYWFGVACAHFEMVIQFGAIAFIGIFLTEEDAVNPFAIFFQLGDDGSWWLGMLSVAVYGLAGAIIGPIYTACTFTLYLNRRATLEAWDVEIMLRQLKPGTSTVPSALQAGVAGLSSLLLIGLLAFGSAPSAMAAEQTAPAELNPAATNPAATNSAATNSAEQCKPPEWLVEEAEPARAPLSQAQADVRDQIQRILNAEELRRYRCEYMWTLKDLNLKPDEEEKNPEYKGPDLGWLAYLIQILLIAALVLLIGWLLYRYRDVYWPGANLQLPQRATEIAGLDIRPESLPDDILAAVQALWQQQQRRAALALLYRATLSRLVHDFGVTLNRGATEQDCLRQALRAHATQRINLQQLTAVREVTQVWLLAAFAARWPDTAAVQALLQQWQQAFAPTATGEVTA